MIKKAIAFTVAAILLFIFTACTFVAANETDTEYPGKVPAESIELSHSITDLYVGESFVLAAELFPFNTYDTVSYSSNDTAVASIDENGTVTANAAGSTTVYAKAGLLSASCRINVSDPPAVSITANVNTLNLKISESFQLEASVLPENAECSRIAFFSDDERIATVDENGLVTAVGAGYTSVGIYVPESPRVRCVVEVNTYSDNIENMRFNSKYYSVLKDGTVPLDLIIEPFGSSADRIVYSSSNEAAAVIDANGIVYGLEYGITQITAHAPSDAAAECTVIVTDRLAPDPVYEITPSRYKYDGKEYTMTSGSDQQEITVMLAGAVYADAQRQTEALKNGKFDFNESFMYLKRIFADGDLNIASLNNTLSHTYDYACENSDSSNSPSTLLGAVRYAGIDALACAALSADAEEQQLIETAEQLDRYNMMHTGFCLPNDPSCRVTANCGGIKTAILSYTCTEDASHASAYSPKRASEDIDGLRKSGADIIIVYLHREGVSDDALSEIFSELAEFGADIAAGVDPDEIGRAEYITRSDGTAMPAIYSLGSISADSDNTNSNDTVILKLSISTMNGKAKIENVEYIPVRLIGSYNGSSYVSVPAVAEEGKELALSLKFTAERMRYMFADVIDAAAFK